MLIFMLLFVFLSTKASDGIIYSAPGDPVEQQWTEDLRGITVRSITNDIRGNTYPALEFESSPDQKGWYLNTSMAKPVQMSMREIGWTWTYISLTKLAPSAGSHTAKFRDGNRLWELQFRQGGSSENGLWLHYGSGKYTHLKQINLNDAYHIFQVTCTPANPGNYDEDDLIAFYVNGKKVHEMRRHQQELTTGVVRGEILDEAAGGSGSFAVNLYRIDAGVGLDLYRPKEGGITILPDAVQPAGDDSAAFNVASRRELFVDHTLIETMTGGAELRMHHPHPAGKVLDFMEEWEGRYANYGTIINDGRQFRLYYRSGNPRHNITNQVTCMAVSDDGIHWDKPVLGLHEQDGSKNNNIVFSDATAAGHNFTPFLDTNPDCLPDAKFKALGGIYRYTKDPEVKGLLGFVSPDGIHWKQIGGNPLIERPSFYAFDSQNIAFWSEAEKKYVGFFRAWIGTNPAQGNYSNGIRWIGKTTSDDFINWSPIEILGIFHAGEEAPKYDLYTNQTFPYYRAPHIYIATATRFMEGRQVVSAAQAKEINVDPQYFRDCSDVILLSMRAGGTAYQQPFLSSFLRPGPGLRNWISRTNYPILDTIPTGDTEMSLYIFQDYAQPTAHIQRYTLRIDGFTSVSAPFEGGTLLTRPVYFNGKKLELNFWTSAAGGIRVELQDRTGTPIKGYTLADCDELIGNEISRSVCWKGSPDVGPLTGKEIRIFFKLKDADVYSFKFNE
ncbi:MAG: hypothetical protein WC959_02345 [Kiritimatiellales bacterium]